MLGVSEKRMRVRRGQNRLDCDLDVTRGRILAAHRTRETRYQLPVKLALGRSRSDSAPTHQSCQILRGNHVEKFGAGGNSHLCEIEQKMPRLTKAIIDL